ncbi:MAG: hypothetical protein V1746_07875 [bacterium]
MGDALDWLRGRKDKKPHTGEPAKKGLRERCRDAWKSTKERVGHAWKTVKGKAGETSGYVTEKLRPSVEHLSSKVTRGKEVALKGAKAAAGKIAEKAPKIARVGKAVLKKAAPKLARKSIIQGLSWSGIGLPVAIIAGVGLAGYELYSLYKEGNLTWGNAAYEVAGYVPYLGTAVIANDVAEAVTGTNYVKEYAGQARDRVLGKSQGMPGPDAGGIAREGTPAAVPVVNRS